MAPKKIRMTLHDWDEYRVLDLGDVEIWDGADLALLRETLTRQITAEGHRLIGVNMACVKYIPSGFFGMLYDWHERGVAVRLYQPQPHVANMLWFRQFFDTVSDETFQLCTEERDVLVVQCDPEWDEEIDWGFEDEPEWKESVSAGR